MVDVVYMLGLVGRVRRSTSSKEVLEVCDFAEKCLGSKPKLSELEKKERNVRRVQAWRMRKRAQRVVDKEEPNPFE